MDPFLAAASVALEHEANWLQTSAETGGDFPAGCCVEASISLADELAAKMPDLDPRYVWGTYAIDVGEASLDAGHAWVEVDGPGGRVRLDLTLGQFLWLAPDPRAGRHPLGIVFEGSPLWHRYRVEYFAARHPMTEAWVPPAFLPGLAS